MMPAMPEKPAATPIPVQLSASEFTQFILPHLTMPKRGPRCKLGYHRVFNLIFTGTNLQPVISDQSMEILEHASRYDGPSPPPYSSNSGSGTLNAPGVLAAGLWLGQVVLDHPVAVATTWQDCSSGKKCACLDTPSG
jgi:hypothetical protein